ncbi:MAG: hypothetical protein ACKO2K_03895 [Alphaproteobacteria bacterium]
MNRWVRVGLLTAFLEYLKSSAEPPAPRPVRTPEPDADPGELQRELAKLAASMNETTQSLKRMIEFQDLTTRATSDGLSRLRDLAADAAEAGARERDTGAAGSARTRRARTTPAAATDEGTTPRRRRRATATSSAPREDGAAETPPPRARASRARTTRRRPTKPAPGDGL